MKIRAAATAIATFVVAIVVAVTVPVSQLRTVSTTTTCCCPDPSKCHCPHEKGGQPDEPSIKACHRERHDAVAPQLPSFTMPQAVIAIAVPRITAAPILVAVVPHAPPVTDEPYGPS